MGIFTNQVDVLTNNPKKIVIRQRPTSHWLNGVGLILFGLALLILADNVQVSCSRSADIAECELVHTDLIHGKRVVRFDPQDLSLRKYRLIDYEYLLNWSVDGKVYRTHWVRSSRANQAVQEIKDFTDGLRQSVRIGENSLRGTLLIGCVFLGFGLSVLLLASTRKASFDLSRNLMSLERAGLLGGRRVYRLTDIEEVRLNTQYRGIWGFVAWVLRRRRDTDWAARLEVTLKNGKTVVVLPYFSSDFYDKLDAKRDIQIMLRAAQEAAISKRRAYNPPG